jgi:hypothetical protein
MGRQTSPERDAGIEIVNRVFRRVFVYLCRVHLNFVRGHWQIRLGRMRLKLLRSYIQDPQCPWTHLLRISRPRSEWRYPCVCRSWPSLTGPVQELSLLMLSHGRRTFAGEVYKEVGSKMRLVRIEMDYLV